MSGERCERFGKWFGGCRFEARWDETAPDPIAIRSVERLVHAAVFFAEDLAMMRNLRASRYVRDICIRCGKTVERTAP